MHKISSLRSDQLVLIDETGVDKSIGTRRGGWAPRGQQLCQVKRLHRGQRLQILPIEEFFGELKMYIKQSWDEHEYFIRADFMSFLEECVMVVGNSKASASGHFRHAGISVDE